MEMQRFKYITHEQKKRDKLSELVDSKGLSREDMVLILTTVAMNTEIVSPVMTWQRFIADILEEEQLTTLKQAIEEGRTPYFYGHGMGKTTLAKILNSIGIAAVSLAMNPEELNAYLHDTKHYQAIKLNKRRPVALIPGLYNVLLEQKDEIEKWIRDPYV